MNLFNITLALPKYHAKLVLHITFSHKAKNITNKYFLFCGKDKAHHISLFCEV